MIVHPALVTALEGRSLHVADDTPPDCAEQVRVLLLLTHSGEILPSQVEELVTRGAGVNHLTLAKEETGERCLETLGHGNCKSHQKEQTYIQDLGFGIIYYLMLELGWLSTKCLK